jgi:hypothetical protein
MRGILDAKAIAHIERFVPGNGMGVGPGQAKAVEKYSFLLATARGHVEKRAIGYPHGSHKRGKVILGTGRRNGGEQYAKNK